VSILLRSLPTRRLLVTLLVAALGFAAAWGTAQGSTTHDLRGTFTDYACPGAPGNTCPPSGSNYPGTNIITAENFSSGEFSGTGSGGGSTWNLTGTVSGDNVTITFVYTNISYESHMTGTVSADSNTLNGTYTASGGGVGAISLYRAGTTTTPTTTTPTTTAPKPPPTGSSPSATSVSCYFDVASGVDTCTAQVADAANPPSAIPTGTVGFTSSGAGAFTAGHECTLRASADAPSIPFCSVTFLPPNSNLPSITASYSGDAHFAPSRGITQFAMTDAPPITDTPSPPPFANEVPNSVTVNTTVPADGTTVATSAEDKDQVSKEQYEKLNKIDVPEVNPEGIGKKDAGKLDELQTAISLVVEAESIKEYDEEVDKRFASLNARASELEHSGYPGQEAEGRALSSELDFLGIYAEKVYEVLHGHPSGAEDARASTAAQGFSARASAVRHKRKIPHKRAGKRVKHVTVLARSVRSHVAAGSYSVTLHFSRAQLKRMIGKRKKLTVYITVFMRVPHKGLKGGMPVVSAKAVTLTRR
jgi:hypothetical protein